ASTSKRFVAFLLIALICLCLGVEDILVPDACGEDRSMLLAQQRSSTLAAAESTQRTSPPDSGDDDHDCLCCCRHLLTSGFFQPVHTLNSSILSFGPGEVVSSVDPQPPYHPPRS
ncbi:MAG: hypothetical protein L0312_27095, partial [Acidobacteria bacterium]|nr:hypothetical protein [Acidobacteriota bacterium]